MPDAALARVGFAVGDFATFRILEPDRRQLVLRLLNHPTDDDFAELEALEDGKNLANWLLTLPAYRNASGEDPED